MKAFLLSAGRGTRLGALTKDIPKCLLEINGKPLLEHWLTHLTRMRIQNVHINLGANGHKVMEYLGKRQWGGMRVSISHESTPIGTAATLAANRDFVQKDFYFFAIYADTWTNMDLRTMLNFHKKRSGLATIGLYKPKNLQAKGVVTIKDGIVTGFEEKPVDPKSDYAFAGVMVAHPVIFKFFDKQTKDIGRDLLPKLVGKMNAFVIRDTVLDIGGSPEEYKLASDVVRGLGLKAL